MTIADLPFPTLAAAARALRQGRISSRELTELVLARIARINPHIGAFTDILAETARREARRADHRLRRDGATPLTGVPVAIKELIDTHPAVCSAGLPFLRGYRPAEDAHVVARLR